MTETLQDRAERAALEAFPDPVSVGSEAYVNHGRASFARGYIVAMVEVGRITAEGTDP